jgi:hypothetical protein
MHQATIINIPMSQMPFPKIPLAFGYDALKSGKIFQVFWWSDDFQLRSSKIQFRYSNVREVLFTSSGVWHCVVVLQCPRGD